MADLGTSPALVYMSRNQSDLIQALSGEIVEDLEFHYTYTADTFPRRSELESSHQKEPGSLGGAQTAWGATIRLMGPGRTNRYLDLYGALTKI